LPVARGVVTASALASASRAESSRLMEWACSRVPGWTCARSASAGGGPLECLVALVVGLGCALGEVTSLTLLDDPRVSRLRSVRGLVAARTSQIGYLCSDQRAGRAEVGNGTAYT